jgi:hypothetical protein
MANPNILIPSKLSRTYQIGKRVWGYVDNFCLFSSPIALLMVLFLGIIAFDHGGQHLAFLRALADDGVEGSGVVGAYQPGDDAFVVQLDNPEEGWDYVFLYTKYYSAATLAGLEDGQRVSVRYPAHAYDPHGVLAEGYDEVKRYGGFLQGVEWFLGAGLLVLLVRPEILFLGLNVDEAFFAQAYQNSTSGAAEPTGKAPADNKKKAPRKGGAL